MCLHRIERSVSEIASVTKRLREADARSGRLSGLASTTVEILTQRLATVHWITSDAQQMVWNTDRRCYRIGPEGSGLAVVASEIRGFAAALATIASSIAQSFEGLTAAAVIRGSDEGAAADAGAALGDSLDCIRDGGERMRSGLSHLMKAPFRSLRSWRRPPAGSIAKRTFGAPFAAIADRLSGLGREAAEVVEEGEAALAAWLGSVEGRYTMARERDVHRAFQPGAEAEEAPGSDLFASTMTTTSTMAYFNPYSVDDGAKIISGVPLRPGISLRLLIGQAATTPAFGQGSA